MSKNGGIISRQNHFHSSFSISDVLINKINIQPFFNDPTQLLISITSLARHFKVKKGIRFYLYGMLLSTFM